MAAQIARVERALDTLQTLAPGDPGAREHVRLVYAFAVGPGADPLWLLRYLDRLEVDPAAIEAAFERLRGALTAGERRAAYGRLRGALEPPRDVILRHLATPPGDLRMIVDLRATLLAALAKRPSDAADLAALDHDLRNFLASRIEVGALELRRLTWRDSAALLERLATLEAVHAVRGWFDLKDRLDDDRRVYAFFHPMLPDAPLVFTEVALTNDTPASIRAILNKDAARVDPALARAATFYSISNGEPGLTGIPFGNALIKRSVEALRAELPQLRTFATLSPLPGFAAWVRELGERAGAGLLERLTPAGWHRDATVTAAVREPLLRLAAQYLIDVKRADGAPLDAVARFHIGNGATVDRLDWLADPTARGLEQSFGVMVNYRYATERVGPNQLAYARTHVVDASPAVRALAAASPAASTTEGQTAASGVRGVVARVRRLFARAPALEQR